MHPQGDRNDVAAIYCRVPHVGDVTTVDLIEQERRCRRAINRAGLTLGSGCVYGDADQKAWRRRGSAEPGWRDMLAAARAGRFGHVFLRLPELLGWQPCDVVALIRTAHRHSVRLHGRIDGRNLGNPAACHALYADAIVECRRRQAASRKARRAHEMAAASGRPHGGGRRPYGYDSSHEVLVESEAMVVQEIYRRFLDGDALRSIALSLNRRGVATAYGGFWTSQGVTRIIDSPRYAGIRTHRGKIAVSSTGQWQTASWPACVRLDHWQAAQRLRQVRLSRQNESRRPTRDYLLTGLLVCDACDRHMVGSMIGAYPTYACTGNSLLTPSRCSRHIAAHRLEEYVQHHAIAKLSTVDFSSLVEELLPSGGPRVLFRVGRTDAATAWQQLPARGRAAALRLLLQVIKIGPKTTARSVFDFGRVHIVDRDLSRL